MSFLFALRGIPGKFIRLSFFKKLGRILFTLLNNFAKRNYCFAVFNRVKVDYILIFSYNNNAKKH